MEIIFQGGDELTTSNPEMTLGNIDLLYQPGFCMRIKVTETLNQSISFMPLVFAQENSVRQGSPRCSQTAKIYKIKCLSFLVSLSKGLISVFLRRSQVALLFIEYQLAQGRQNDESANHDPKNADGDDQAHAGDALVRRER